jgi:hypothetical protein
MMRISVVVSTARFDAGRGGFFRPLGRLRVVARGASCRSFDRRVVARAIFDDGDFSGV